MKARTVKITMARVVLDIDSSPYDSPSALLSRLVRGVPGEIEELNLLVRRVIYVGVGRQVIGRVEIGDTRALSAKERTHQSETGSLHGRPYLLDIVAAFVRLTD